MHCILIVHGDPAILEEPKTQYALIGKNATFTCKTSGGKEAYWALNYVPMTVTYHEEKQNYEDRGVEFKEDVIQDQYYNLTMTIHASLDLNNTIIFCSVIGSDWTITMGQEVHFIVFDTLRRFCVGFVPQLAVVCLLYNRSGLIANYFWSLITITGFTM